MFIGPRDIKESSDLKRREERKRRRDDLPSTSAAIDEDLTGDSDSTPNAESSCSTDEEYLPSESFLKRRCLENHLNKVEFQSKHDSVIPKISKSLPYFSEACDRVGVSDRSAALLSTSLLEDIGVVERNCPDNVIDRYA